MKTGAEKLADKQKRLRKSGNIADHYQADMIDKGMRDPMDAKMTAQERGGMALESGAAAGAAVANMGLGDALLAGADPNQVAAMNQQIQQGVTQAGYAGAKGAEESDQKRVFDANQAKADAQQAAIQEQVRKRTQTLSDLQQGVSMATDIASTVTGAKAAQETLKALSALNQSGIGGAD